MAFYSYLCENDHAFTARRDVADRQSASCPTCSASAEMQFSPTGDFYIPGIQSPHRKSGDELTIGRFHHGKKYVDKFDPNVKYREEARADAEETIVKHDGIRQEARSEFDQSYDYLNGPERADARETMERDLDKKGVRR